MRGFFIWHTLSPFFHYCFFIFAAVRLLTIIFVLFLLFYGNTIVYGKAVGECRSAYAVSETGKATLAMPDLSSETHAENVQGNRVQPVRNSCSRDQRVFADAILHAASPVPAAVYKISGAVNDYAAFLYGFKRSLLFPNHNFW